MTAVSAVKTLVDIFLTDKDAKCRQEAARMLVKHVPDVMIRTYAKEIVALAKQRSGDDFPGYYENITLLVGKTGSAEARKLLMKWDAAYRKKDKSTPYYTNMALAKLGDTKRERLLIDQFEKACKPAKKSQVPVRKAVEHVSRLAYIGQPASVKALARQYRNPLHCRKIGSDYFHVMSLRFAITYAFAHIWPDNELFSFTYYKTSFSGEADYVKVEVWLKAHLGVKWNTQRPAFTEEGAGHTQLDW